MLAVCVSSLSQNTATSTRRAGAASFHTSAQMATRSILSSSQRPTRSSPPSATNWGSRRRIRSPPSSADYPRSPRLFRSRKLLQTQPDHLDHGLGSSGANRLCDPLLCNRENVVDIVLSDRATSAQNIYE